jgi:hypothetical protein
MNTNSVERETVSNEDADISQTFQIHPATDPPTTIHVRTRFDYPGNGRRIVLLGDISAAAMGNVECIMNGTSVVPRLKRGSVE